MTEIAIKGYSRKSKSGKTITVKGYNRRVGRKGIKSPKRKSSTTAAPGEEIKAKIEEKKSRYPAPKMTKEEIAAWDATARKTSNTSAAASVRDLDRKRKITEKKKQEVRNAAPAKAKKKPFFERLENSIAKFTEKYGNKYKKML